jgi:hypothetical protein
MQLQQSSYIKWTAKRDWVYTQSQRFGCGIVLSLIPEFKRLVRVE